MRFQRAETLWLALVGLFLVLAVWWFPGKGSVETDSYSVGFEGKKAFFQTIQRIDGQTFRSTSELVPEPDWPARRVILGPARQPTDEEWQSLFDEVYYGSTLVFAASALDTDVDLGPFHVKVVGLHAMEDQDGEVPEEQSTTSGEAEAVPVGEADSNATAKETEEQESDEAAEFDWESIFVELSEHSAETDLVAAPVTWRSDARLVLDEDEWDVVVRAAGEPQAAWRTLGDGVVVVVACDDIFNNSSLMDKQNALLAYQLLDIAAIPDSSTWFDETLNSSGTPKVLGILFDPTLRPLTLQLLLLGALFGWAGAIRFGPIEELYDTRRRSIVEHAEALGLLYYRAKAGNRAIHSQLEYLKQELRRLYGSTFRVDSAEAIARQANVPVEEVQSILQQSQQATKLSPSAHEAGRLLKQLSRLIHGIRQ